MKKNILALAVLSLFTCAVSWAGFFDEKDLFNACKDGLPQTIKRILESVNVNCADEEGMTPLMQAALSNPAPEVIPVLI